MIDDYRLVLCALGSLIAHFVIKGVLDTLPPHVEFEPTKPLTVRVIQPPPPDPPPEPEKKPEPPKPDPKQVHEQVKTVQQPAKRAPEPVDAPPVDHPAVTAETTTQPTFGVDMSSTSTKGPEVQVGNTTRTDPSPGSAAPVKQLAQPVAAYEVTKMPLPLGRCSGAYTDAAKQAAVEGVVVLDVIVDENGRTREIVAVEKLGYGLTEAAIAALRDCRFTPGEKDGKPVPVRVRGFKIRFVMQDAR